MGIKVANNTAFVAQGRVYEYHWSVRCAPCQVSGQYDSGANVPSWLPTVKISHNKRELGLPTFALHQFPKTRRHLKGFTVCGGGTSRAVKWPIGVTKTNGPRRSLPPASNVRGSTLAAKWWLTLRLACAAWKITGWLPFKRSFRFPSRDSFHRQFKN